MIMKHHVSPSTAKRLKEAGYPQPEFKLGQVWADYSQEDQIELCVMFGPHGMDAKVLNEDMVYVVGKQHLFYSPCATEIIEQPRMSMCAILFDDNSIWNCNDYDMVLEHMTSNENPAEAAAEMWLELKSKSEQK